MLRITLMGLLAFAGILPAAEIARAAPPFRAALEAHLTAIAARDMKALLPTLTNGTELTMIGPSGRKLDTRQQFVDFHRAWFASKDEGRFEREIVRVIESPTLAHALVKYRYSSKDEAGKMRSYAAWLALTFALENGTWRLVFDQNTSIKEDAAKPHHE